MNGQTLFDELTAVSPIFHRPKERRPLYCGPNASEQTCRRFGGLGGGWGSVGGLGGGFCSIAAPQFTAQLQ